MKEFTGKLNNRTASDNKRKLREKDTGKPQSSRKKKARRISAGCLFILFFPLLIAAGVVLWADWVNYPLLPVDLFNTLRTVEFQCKISGESREFLTNAIRETGGVSISIMDKEGKPLKSRNLSKLKTDLVGKTIISLPEGRYRVAASLRTIKQNRLIRFQTRYGPEGEPVDISEESRTIILELFPGDDPDLTRAWNLFKEFTGRGNLHKALKLAKTILQDESQGKYEDPAEQRTILELKRNVDRITDIFDLLEQIEQAPNNAYNTSIGIVEDILLYLERICPESAPDELKIQTHEEILYPAYRIESLKQARDAVIFMHLENFNRFMDIRHYPTALEEWLKIIENQELYREDQDMGEDLMAFFDEVKERIPEIQDKVKAWLISNHEQARKLLGEGKTEDSWKHMSVVFRNYDIFKKNLELSEDLWTQNESLREDARRIMEAEQAYNESRYEEALRLMEMVDVEGTWIQGRIKELKVLIM